jgi:hypothetical protein
VNEWKALIVGYQWSAPATFGMTVLSGLSNGAALVWKLGAEAGGLSLRTSTRPTLNRGTQAARTCEHLHIALKVSHAPMLGT